MDNGSTGTEDEGNGHGYGSTPDPSRALLLEPAQGDVIPDTRELHRVIAASVRELPQTARLERQAGPVDAAQLERTLRYGNTPSS